MGRLLAVQLMMMSNSCSRAGRSASLRASAPKCVASFSPRSSVRLAMADMGRLLGREMGRGQFDHLAGADEQHLGAGQIFEQLRGQAHGRSGHADAVAADLGRGPDLFGDRERTLEQLMQGGAEGAGFFGRPHGALHLAEDLRFAQNHGVETGGHAEGMPSRAVAMQAVGVTAQQGRADAACAGHPVQCHVDIGGGAGEVDFRAVAGRQQRGFRRLAGRGRPVRHGVAQAEQSRLQLIEGKCKTAPQIKRRRCMVDAQCPDCHR